MHRTETVRERIPGFAETILSLMVAARWRVYCFPWEDWSIGGVVAAELVLAMAHLGRPTLASLDRTAVRTNFL